MPTTERSTTDRTVRLAEVQVTNEEGSHADRLLTLSGRRGSLLTVYSMEGGCFGPHRVTEPTGKSGGWARVVAHWEGYVRATVQKTNGMVIGALGTE